MNITRERYILTREKDGVVEIACSHGEYWVEISKIDNSSSIDYWGKEEYCKRDLDCYIKSTKRNKHKYNIVKVTETISDNKGCEYCTDTFDIGAVNKHKNYCDMCGRNLGGELH